MASDRTHLLMVYNADGGLFAMVSDAVHKVLSPATYPCSLCAVTYGAVSMRGEWRDYLADLDAKVTFHHRDDFALAWPDARFALPVILVEQGGTLSKLVPAAELDRVVTELIAVVGERLAQLQRE